MSDGREEFAVMTRLIRTDQYFRRQILGLIVAREDRIAAAYLYERVMLAVAFDCRGARGTSSLLDIRDRHAQWNLDTQSIDFLLLRQRHCVSSTLPRSL
jgi:hypothetical protein